MATTTRQALRQGLSDAVGDWYGTLACDSGSTTTIVDTELLDIPQGNDDDGFLYWYVICTSGNNIGEVRVVSGYVASTTTITVSRAFTNAMATQTYEVHRHNPVQYHSAINRASEELFPFLYLPVRDETLIVDNLLSNPLFDTYSGGFTSWTEVGSPTVTEETTRVIQGSSAKVVASGADGQLTQAPTVNVPGIEGKTVTCHAWAYTTSTTGGRLRLDWDGGSTFTNGDYHTGADQWERISVSGTVPSGATQVKMICEAEDGTTVYFDFASMVIESVYEYTLPANLKLGPYQVYQQISDNNPTENFEPLFGRPIAGRRLRLVGKGLLTVYTDSETATMEVGANQTELMISQAAYFLNRQLAQRAATQQRQRYLEDMKLWQDQTEEFKRVPGIRTASLSAAYDAGLAPTLWHVEENSTGRVLVLDQPRGSLDGLGFTTLI